MTRHGIPAVMRVPIGEIGEKLTNMEIVEGIRALRKQIKPDRMSVREMVEEGRPF